MLIVIRKLLSEFKQEKNRSIKWFATIKEIFIAVNITIRSILNIIYLNSRIVFRN